MTRIRLARPDEYELVGQITYAGFGHTQPGARQPNPERKALLLDAAARAETGALLVAEDDDGRLIGTASLLRGGSPLTRQTSEGETELRLLAVLPDARGTGAGWDLMQAAIAQARAWQASAVVLDTGPRNFTSQRLYHRLGFERVIERETKPALSGEPLAVFVYDLVPTDPLLVRLARPHEYGAPIEALWQTVVSAGGNPPDTAAIAHGHELWVVEHRADGHLLGAVVTLRPDTEHAPDEVVAPLPHPIAIADGPHRAETATRIEAHLAWLRHVRERLARHELIA